MNRIEEDYLRGRCTCVSYKITIIEDDQALAKQISRLLSRYGYDCEETKDFSAIDGQIEAGQPDLILLDINLPKFDGFYWCRRLRERTKVPILIMSARNDTADQIRGMESGADDYITKPFDPDVLLAKVNATIRRNYGTLKPGMADQGTEKCGVLFWENRQTVVYQGAQAELSFTETQLFRELFDAFPDAVSRGELFMQVWDSDTFVEENTLNVNIRRLREKLAAARLPIEIRVVRSLGYKLVIGGSV